MTKRILTLFLLHMKAALKKFPVILFSTLIFSVTILLLCYGLTTFSTETDKPSVSKASIGVIVEDTGAYTHMAITYIASMKSVKNVCTIKIMESDDGISSLNQGSIDALVYLPEGFLNSILNGTNIPAHIILNNSGVNSESRLIRAMINAAADDLATAQAGIYTLGNAATMIGITGDTYQQINLDINEKFMTFVLNRTDLFKSIQTGATGDLSVIEFYTCSGIVLLLLLSGISCVSLLRPASKSTTTLLYQSKLPYIILPICQVLSCTIVFCIPLTIIICVVTSFSITALLNIFFMTLTAFSFAMCIYQCCQNETTGMLVIFLTSILMLFVSGGFIPSALLPQILPVIGNSLPSGAMLSCTNGIFTGTAGNVMLCAIYTLVLHVICAVINIHKNRSC